MQTPLRLFPDEGETIEGVGAALRAGKTTCAAVLEHCFRQIDLWDERVRAWVVVDRAGAMRQARALDAELAAGRCRGPLHGIPIGVKDIIDVKGLPTGAGFRPWRDRVAEADAAIVARLRAGGAVILGKTVTTQFAWIDPPVTRNPWNLDRTPGGSSSGSAAAVATGMCLGAIGSQTGGSIVRPASFCGVAGLKPDYDDVSAAGIVPLAPTLDHPGPIARTTRDLSLIYCHIGGPGLAHGDPWGDPVYRADLPFSVGEVGEKVEWRLGTVRRDSPPKLIRPRGFFERRAEPDTLDAFERALGALKAAGATVVDAPDDALDFEGLVREHRTLMAAEAAAEHESRFAAHRDDYAPQIRSLIEEGLAIPLTRYVRSQRGWRARHELVERLFGDRFEVVSFLDGGSVTVVTPATLGPAPDPTTTGNPCFNSPWSYLGLPTLSVPAGLSAEGLPLAVQLTGRAGFVPFDVGTWCEDVFRRHSLAGSQ